MIAKSVNPELAMKPYFMTGINVAAPLYRGGPHLGTTPKQTKGIDIYACEIVCSMRCYRYTYN